MTEHRCRRNQRMFFSAAIHNTRDVFSWRLGSKNMWSWLASMFKHLFSSFFS